jgi:N-acetylmuramoyl-L-alanine amidase
MRRLILLLILLLGFSSAQYESRLLVGFQETQAIYPGGDDTAFGPAQLIAQALGLGYLEAGGRVYLSLGSTVSAFYITDDGPRAASRGAAYRAQGSVWVPVRQLATNLDLVYRNDYGASVLALKPARLLEVKRANAGGAERYLLSFDREVQVRLLVNSPPRLALIGVTAAPEVPPDSTLTLTKTEWGSELTLPPGSDPPRLLFLPRQVVVERGNANRPVRVVLDAGHGGDDTGVIVGKLAEKDLTLSLAQRLEKLLEARGLEVVLTRRADASVPLLARAQYASSGQVFLSLHAAAGAQAHIYSYPEVQTLRLLEKGRELSPKTPAAQKGLLERYVAPPGSAARFAQAVAEALAGAAVSAEVSEDAMYVLSQSGGAAVLAELGFENLRTPQSRDAVASALAQAVFSYLGLPSPKPASNAPQPKPGAAKP